MNDSDSNAFANFFIVFVYLWEFCAQHTFSVSQDKQMNKKKKDEKEEERKERRKKEGKRKKDSEVWTVI